MVRNRADALALNHGTPALLKAIEAAGPVGRER